MNPRKFQLSEAQSLFQKLDFNISGSDIDRIGTYVEGKSCAIRVKPYPSVIEGKCDVSITIFPLDRNNSQVSGIEFGLFKPNAKKLFAETNQRGQAWFRSVRAGEGYRIKKLTAVGKWFENIFQKDFLPPIQLLKPAFGGVMGAANAPLPGHLGTGIKRAKKIDLTEAEIVLVVQVEHANDGTLKVTFNIHPSEAQYLPQGLQFEALDELGNSLGQVQAQNKDQLLYLELDGWTNEEILSVKIALGNVSVTENFVNSSFLEEESL